MTWSFVLTDRVGNQLGELRNATARSLRFPLNRTPTFNFTIKADNPFASLLVDLDKVLVKAYDDSTGSKVLRFYGPCVGRDKTRNAQEGTIPISAAGVQWRLDRRLIGQNIAGATFGTTSLRCSTAARSWAAPSTRSTPASRRTSGRSPATPASAAAASPRARARTSPTSATSSPERSSPGCPRRSTAPTTCSARWSRPRTRRRADRGARRRPGDRDDAAERGVQVRRPRRQRRGVEGHRRRDRPVQPRRQHPVRLAGHRDAAADRVAGHGRHDRSRGAVRGGDPRRASVRRPATQARAGERQGPQGPEADHRVHARRGGPVGADRAAPGAAAVRGLQRRRRRPLPRDRALPGPRHRRHRQGYTETPTVDLLVRVFAIQIDLDDAGVAQTAVALQDDSG
jgi:hypothetical protein